MSIEKTVVWYNVTNCGDGSAAVQWFLTEQDALDEYDQQYEPFSEDGVDSVETFIGSDIHQAAIRGSRELAENLDLEEEDLEGNEDIEFERQ